MSLRAALAARPRAAAGERRAILRRPSPALIVAVVSLVLSMSGLADAARNGLSALIAGHRVSARPHPGGLLLLGRDGRFAASAIPTVGDAKRLDGKTAAELEGSCPPSTADIGSWCLEAAPFPLTKSEVGQNNYLWAAKTCVKQGGWLPTAAQLLGAAERVRLSSVITDNEDTSVRALDPSRGLQDAREMSSTLVTTEAGSAAAGFEGVSEGSTGNPRTGQANPTPEPANPLPESLQYVTVYSNHENGGFAGSVPVKEAMSFRCAYNKTPGVKVEE